MGKYNVNCITLKIVICCIKIQGKVRKIGGILILKNVCEVVFRSYESKKNHKLFFLEGNL